MKKLLTTMLLILVCFALFACTAGEQGEPATDTPTDIPADATSPDEAETPADVPEDTSSDSSSDTEADTQPSEETETDAPVETSPVTLYQLAPERNSLMQSYVIKTQNGKLIVIDGGVDGEGKDREPYMPAALRAIAGVGEDGYFEVEAWFLSHAHKDHIYELSKMLSVYSEDSNYKINNIYFDFPEFGSESYPGTNADMEASRIRESINHFGEVIGAEVAEGSTYYDQINGAVINAASVAEGLSFEIDGVRIEVLQTWSPEDGTSNVNDTSLVLRMWMGEQSVMFLNDLGSIGGRRLLKTYGDKLKSDVVQMAHHGQAGVTREVYYAINAQVNLWPTPIWVWNNENKTYQIDEVREWLYGESFLKADDYNIVSCLYSRYPSRITSAANWARVLDGMKIEFPYVLPDRPILIPDETEDETVVITPVEHEYVSEGLVAYYNGAQNTRDGHDASAAAWEDLVCGRDMTVTKDGDNYFTDAGLRTKNAMHKFPQAVVDVVNGQSFTVELLLGDFVSVGNDFNTFLSSSDDHFALFRRNSENVLELKTLGNGRIKIASGLELLQNSLITVAYTQGDACRIYVNGELRGEISTATGSLSVGNFFIGHTAANKQFDTTYRSIRFYDRALTAEEAMANAVVDGVATAESAE